MVINNKLSREAANQLKAANTASEIIAILTAYKDIKLGPTPLGIAFEKLYIDNNGFSSPISINELVKLHPAYRTTNGGDWCRSDTSYLGKLYYIVRLKEKGSISAVKIDGKNKGITIDQGIKSSILKTIKAQSCSILDISTNIECDHKDGQKNDGRVGDKDTQQLEDFQPLCKTANDAKRTHCKTCKLTGKRYDATRLGYSVPFTHGDENTKVCYGCYWFDPKAFNAEISKNFDKSDK